MPQVWTEQAIAERYVSDRKVLFLGRAEEGECVRCGPGAKFRGIESPFYGKAVLQCLGCGTKVALRT